jgi:hypothetical protein
VLGGPYVARRPDVAQALEVALKVALMRFILYTKLLIIQIFGKFLIISSFFVHFRIALEGI